MPGKVTRRGLAALAASPLLMSTGAAEAQAQTPGAAEDDLSIQRENLRRWREATRQVKLPRALEPAFVFKP
jgi:hypothetical protein